MIIFRLICLLLVIRIILSTLEKDLSNKEYKVHYPEIDKNLCSIEDRDNGNNIFKNDMNSIDSDP